MEAAGSNPPKTSIDDWDLLGLDDTGSQV